jgi:diaminohydroxyphosphoribosylaminopyrimidine deaminase/5-amino-6-(5-phosphoribosylamino)uracil reductase
MNDIDYMKIALELAVKGMGFVNPNPMVGAVIVKNDRIIGKGWHRKCGELHAERNAFADCSEDCTGASIYVTLEPCCHYGKTPPCTEAIIEHKIKRVIIGSSDPNPLVAGKGVKILREHGIEVTEGILKEECDELNEIFMHFITTGMPFVTMKYAMTADGKIAAYTGKSQWITGEDARQNVQLDRLKHAAIMVGVGTVLADDPMLTCRLEGGRNPLRVICDTHLRTPLESKIVQTAREIPTIIASCSDDIQKISEYQKYGCRILKVSENNGHIDLWELMQILGNMKIDSVLLEGGGELNWSALKSRIVSKVQAYIAPKLFGGETAKSPIAGMGVSSPDEAFMLENSRIRQVGNDFLIESRVKNVYGNS